MLKQTNHQRLEKERLLAQNPFLQKVIVKPFGESDYTAAQISDFIEGCWKNYYRDPVRIIFSPDFLTYLGLGEKDGNYSLIAEYDGRLIGTVLAFKNTYGHGNQHFYACASTGLTTDPAMRGKRIAQLLNHHLYELFIDDGCDFGMFWLDSRFKAAGSSFQIYKKENKRIHAILEKKILGKFLDYQRTVELGNYSLRQKAILKAGNMFFPARYKMTRGLEVIPYEASMLQDVLSLLDEFQNENHILRVFHADEMARRLGFSSRTCQSVVYIVKKNGRFGGVIYGFTNPILPTHMYIQLDGMLFHPCLNYKDRKAFVSAFEYEAQRCHGCFAIIVPETVLNDRIVKFGYIPIATQALGAFFYHDRLGYDETPLMKLFAELR